MKRRGNISYMLFLAAGADAHAELEVLAELRLLYLAFAHRKPRIDLLHPAIRIHFFCSFSVYGTTSTTVSVSPSTTKRISTSPYGTPYTRFPSC